ncbi:MAG TPA: hypothetical protein VE263_22790 [Candidatus Angelobacter sp.]|nr:hypothetical protein [Candidatus Angelobacter sp.]
MLAWLLILIVVAVAAIFLYGIFRWVSADPAIDEERAREQFRAEQDWRSARRSGEAPAPADARERLQNVP